MTACMYISPNRVPAIVADTFVTTEYADIQLGLPSNIGSRGVQGIFAPAVLNRKIYFFGNRTALAFSGDANTILTFARNVEDQIVELEQIERPMSHLGPLANQLNSQLGPESQFHFLGATALVSDGKWIGNNPIYGVPGQSSDLSILNWCFARGTGAQKLLREAKEYNSFLENIRDTSGYVLPAEPLV
jgi:hypothetical protein